MELRTNPGIIVERAHTNGNLRAIRPISAEQARAALMTERFYRALALPINLDQFFTVQQPELVAQNTRLGADRGARMFSTSIAVTMTGLDEWWFDFEPHTTAQTASPNQIRHRGS